MGELDTDDTSPEQVLVAALVRGGGTVSTEFWVPFMRTLPSRKAVDRIERTARAWRSEHGLDPDEPFVVGEPMD